MSQSMEFKEIRQKVFLAYHGDGLVGALVGLGIIGFGVGMATDASAFIVLSWIPFMLYVPLKSRITISRIGYVKFDSARTTSNRLILTLLTGIGTLAMFLGLFVFVRTGEMSRSMTELLGKYYMLLLGSFVAIAFVVGGALAGIKRFFAQAVLAMVVLMTGIELGIDPPVYVMVWGGLTFLIGAVLLVQFLRRYPVIHEGDDHVA
ncbi:MAG: hypothetical protein ACE5FD_14900 [Anaerolineae bacterium]